MTVRNGWTLRAHADFAAKLAELADAVEKLKAADPNGYRTHPTAKFLKRLLEIVTVEVPRDPAAKEFRQGTTLGDDYTHWRRAKFLSRFRLFFRYDSKAKIIIFAFLNDENSLRKSGSKTDPYAVFAKRLKAGDPPDSWDELLQAAKGVALPPDDAGASGDAS